MNAGDLLATTRALLGQAVYAQGRLAEADEPCRLAANAATIDDIFTQVICRGVKAKILAGEGRRDQAEALAREAVAVALAEPTDWLSLHGDTMLDLAEVLRACGRADGSDRAIRTGLALTRKKAMQPPLRERAHCSATEAEKGRRSSQLRTAPPQPAGRRRRARGGLAQAHVGRLHAAR